MFKTAISANDPDAIPRLKERLDIAQRHQERMKEANKIIKVNPHHMSESLVNAGFSEDEIRSILKPNFMGVIGYDSYELNNNNGRIRQIKARIKNLEQAVGRKSAEVRHDGFILGADAEANRVYIKFADRPKPDICKMLKRAGFKWAPSQDRWQRQWNPQGEYAISRVKGLLSAKP